MALRTLVAGSDMCSAGGDGAGPSNAVGALVNQLLGGAGKTQETLRDLPGHHALPQMQQVPLTAEAAAAAAAAGLGGMHGPGLMHGPGPMHGPGGMPPQALDALLGGPRAMPGHRPQAHQPPGSVPDMVAEFEAMQRAQAQAQGHAPAPPGGALLHGPPPALAPSFRAFLAAAGSRGAAVPAPAAPLPPGALSVPDKCRIRDRATILARQLYAEQGQGYADGQVARLLASLAIDPAALPGALHHVHDEGWHGIWQQQQQAGGRPPPGVAAEVAAAGHAASMEAVWREQQQMRARPWQQQLPQGAPSTGWADEFAAQAAPPQSWAEEFTHGEGEKWAGEFQAAAAGVDAAADARGASAADAMAATRRMVEVLSSDADPKMRNSQFLQFLSKMSRGELLLDEGGLKAVDPAAAAAARQWADEFDAAAARPPGAGAAWAEDFARQQGGAGASTSQQAQAQRGDWADEFAAGFADLGLGAGGAATQEDLDTAWAAVGSGAVPLNGPADWVREFGEGAVPPEWEQLYSQAAADAAAGFAPGGALRGRQYAFTDPNPFLGDEAALAKGKDLFKRGLLTEAALALEAEVRARPGNAEAWRLLGTVHAENDDDAQAIAAMGKALDADPTDQGVLLSLGVSHTNELDQAEAVGYLSRWLAGHPAHGPAAVAAGPPPDSSQLLSHTLRTFSAAAAAAPRDAELLIATGVLQHLGRDYDAAIRSFRAALELAPGDYSLWNKLGATLANHSHSAEAVGAYQRALDLKPNYMRAWTNMGVAYANVGDYTRSAAFYTRALGLNPGADHVWGYLRTSLACAGGQEMLAAADRRDLPALQAGLPL